MHEYVHTAMEYTYTSVGWPIHYLYMVKCSIMHTLAPTSGPLNMLLILECFSFRFLTACLLSHPLYLHPWLFPL